MLRVCFFLTRYYLFGFSFDFSHSLSKCFPFFLIYIFLVILLLLRFSCFKLFIMDLILLFSFSFFFTFWTVYCVFLVLFCGKKGYTSGLLGKIVLSSCKAGLDINKWRKSCGNFDSFWILWCWFQQVPFEAKFWLTTDVDFCFSEYFWWERESRWGRGHLG